SLALLHQHICRCLPVSPWPRGWLDALRIPRRPYRERSHRRARGHRRPPRKPIVVRFLPLLAVRLPQLRIQAAARLRHQAGADVRHPVGLGRGVSQPGPLHLEADLAPGDRAHTGPIHRLALLPAPPLRRPLLLLTRRRATPAWRRGPFLPVSTRWPTA